MTPVPTPIDVTPADAERIVALIDESISAIDAHLKDVASRGVLLLR